MRAFNTRPHLFLIIVLSAAKLCTLLAEGQNYVTFLAEGQNYVTLWPKAKTTLQFWPKAKTTLYFGQRPKKNRWVKSGKSNEKRKLPVSNPWLFYCHFYVFIM